MPHQADIDPLTLRSRLEEEARAAGFDRIGFAPASLPAEVQNRFRAWIEEGGHGDMAWMAETQERRRTPDALWPEARSVILLAMNYGPEADPLETPVPPDHANISVYARNKDYHDLVKKRLKRVARWLVSETGSEAKVFVDTAPVLEKPLAARSALGWQGKHTNLVSDALGSWFFIGSIFTSLEIEPDEPHADRCGSCRACLDSCPTNAFPAPYRLDARRCISYLTIEHKGHIAREFREPMGNRIYGCDDCLAVCPWNKFAQAASEAALQARDDLKSPSLDQLLDLDDETFRTLFRGSPVKRIGRDRFVRNVLIAAGNSGEVRLLPSVVRLLDDASPLVRAMAVWALARLASKERFLEARDAHMTGETDADVRAEWASPPVPSDAAGPR
ncbi:MAG: tRNA epoxyqueuosine(34) reductase QueG [Parvibaculaceae bacterium]